MTIWFHLKNSLSVILSSVRVKNIKLLFYWSSKNYQSLRNQFTKPDIFHITLFQGTMSPRQPRSREQWPVQLHNEHFRYDADGWATCDFCGNRLFFWKRLKPTSGYHKRALCETTQKCRIRMVCLEKEKNEVLNVSHVLNSLLSFVSFNYCRTT